MLIPVVSVIVARDLEVKGREFKAGGKYVMEKQVARQLQRTDPGCLRIVIDEGNPPYRDKMLHEAGIRRG